MLEKLNIFNFCCKQRQYTMELKIQIGNTWRHPFKVNEKHYSSCRKLWLTIVTNLNLARFDVVVKQKE